MNRLTLITLLSLCCLSGNTALASTTLLDTGTPTGAHIGFLPGYGLAAKFAVETPFVVSEINGFFASIPGDVTLAIYGDGGNTPDLKNEIFTGTVPILADGTDSNWFGIDTMRLQLEPDYYWVAFEWRNKVNSYPGDMRGGAPNPAIDGADGYPALYGYDQFNYGIGVRIVGNPVPLPGAIWFLGSGLLGCTVLRRKTKKIRSNE